LSLGLGQTGAAHARERQLLLVDVMAQAIRKLDQGALRNGVVDVRDGTAFLTAKVRVPIRGIVENDYGVDLNKAHWTVQEGAHVAEYKDPPELNRDSMEHDLLEMLLAREIDAVIYGANLPDDPRLKTVIENPKEEAANWFKKRTRPLSSRFRLSSRAGFAVAFLFSIANR